MRKLTHQESFILLEKGTEPPFSGEYWNHFEKGVYCCKQCNSVLFDWQSKFHSGCGWPSFDDCIQGAIKQALDADGKRIEILCANCGGHLGHVFFNEGYTHKNTRHCVNSLALQFKKV